MPETIRPRSSLLDDDIEVLDALQGQLRSRFDVTATCDAKEAVRRVVSSGPFALVMSDLRMPGMDGVSLF